MHLRIDSRPNHPSKITLAFVLYFSMASNVELSDCSKAVQLTPYFKRSPGDIQINNSIDLSSYYHLGNWHNECWLFQLYNFHDWLRKKIKKLYYSHFSSLLVEKSRVIFDLLARLLAWISCTSTMDCFHEDEIEWSSLNHLRPVNEAIISPAPKKLLKTIVALTGMMLLTITIKYTSRGIIRISCIYKSSRSCICILLSDYNPWNGSNPGSVASLILVQH